MRHRRKTGCPQNATAHVAGIISPCLLQKRFLSFLFLCCVIPPERVGIVYKSINLVAMVFSTFNMVSCQDLKVRGPWDEVANSFFCFVLFFCFFFNSDCSQPGSVSSQCHMANEVSPDILQEHVSKDLQELL